MEHPESTATLAEPEVHGPRSRAFGRYAHRVARPRGVLTDDQLRRLTKASQKRADAAHAYRAEVLAVIAEGASYAEVSKATGLSKDTLQRWKKEADDGPTRR